MPLETNWQIEAVLSSLRGVRRIDDGTDLLAFRVVGEHPSRSAYVYRYGDDPTAINYDLEDAAAETGEWDNAVHRGEVWAAQDLSDVVSRWLNPLALPNS